MRHPIRKSSCTWFAGHNPELLGQGQGGLNTVWVALPTSLMTEDKMIAALDPNGFVPFPSENEKWGLGGVIRNLCLWGSRCWVGPGCQTGWNGHHWWYRHPLWQLYRWYSAGISVPWNMFILLRPDSTIHESMSIPLAKRMGKTWLAQEFKYEADIVVGGTQLIPVCSHGLCGRILPNEMGLHQKPMHPANLYPANPGIAGSRCSHEIVSRIQRGQGQTGGHDWWFHRSWNHFSPHCAQLLGRLGRKSMWLSAALNSSTHVSMVLIFRPDWETISANHTTEEVCEIIGADSDLPVYREGMIEAIGID